MLGLSINNDIFSIPGATNVGSVQIYVDEQLKTNKWLGLSVGTLRNNDYDEVQLPNDVTLGKGELVGQFNMGSTIVLIFEAPKNFTWVFSWISQPIPSLINKIFQVQFIAGPASSRRRKSGLLCRWKILEGSVKSLSTV